MPNVSESREEYGRRLNTVYSIITGVPNSSLPDAVVQSFYDDPKAGDEYKLVQDWMKANQSQSTPTA